MKQTSKKQQEILSLLLQNKAFGSSQIHKELVITGEETSLVTIKRELSRMVAERIIIASGRGRSRVYQISALGRIFSKIDAKTYCAIEPDKRYGLEHYNFELLPSLPSEIFTPACWHGCKTIRAGLF